MNLVDKLEMLTQRALKLRNAYLYSLRHNRLSNAQENLTKLIRVNSEITDATIEFLERIKKSKSNGSIRSAIYSDVEIPHNAPTNVHRIHRDRSE